jgi:ADP-heptose:LPS heptosyltransferase
VVDFFANPRSAYYSFLTNAKTRLSYGFGHRKWAYNLTPPKSKEPAYAAKDRLNLLSAIGIRCSDVKLDFYPNGNDRKISDKLLKQFVGEKYFTVSPVSRRQFNRWPLDYYAKVCKTISEKYNLPAVILAGPGEEDVAEKLASYLSEIKILNPKIDKLGVLGAIFENAKFHIGNDNGPKHIAVASGAPTFTIYGPHSHISWTYPDANYHSYIIPGDVDDECASDNHICGKDCIHKIKPEAVIDRLTEFIERITENKSKA